MLNPEEHISSRSQYMKSMYEKLKIGRIEKKQKKRAREIRKMRIYNARYKRE